MSNVGHRYLVLSPVGGPSPAHLHEDVPHLSVAGKLDSNEPEQDQDQEYYQGQCQEQDQEQDQEKVQYLLDPPASGQVESPVGPGVGDVQVEGLLEGLVLPVHVRLSVSPGVEEAGTKHRDVLLDLRVLGSRKLKRTKELNKGFVFDMFSR